MNAPRLLSRRTASICFSCRQNLLRQFSSTPTPFGAFQSYSLPTSTPPRTAPTSESTITHTIQTPQPLPKVHETRPLQQANGSVARPTPATQSPPVADRRAEAHPSTPTAAPTTTTGPSSSAPAAQAVQTPTATTTTTTTAAAAPAPRPRSKLRAPRKAAMKLTASAVSHLQSLLDQPEPRLIKVGVRNRGCSGLAYHLEYVDKPGKFDEAIEQDGVQVLIDSKALFSIIGSEMDWVEDKLSARFVFRNPNISESFPLPLLSSPGPCWQGLIHGGIDLTNGLLPAQRRNADAESHLWFNTPSVRLEREISVEKRYSARPAS